MHSLIMIAHCGYHDKIGDPYVLAIGFVLKEI